MSLPEFTIEIVVFIFGRNSMQVVEIAAKYTRHEDNTAVLRQA